jgi:hypothetical protein
MTVSLPQGSPVTIERLCRQAGVSRAGYYRFWRTSAPRAHDKNPTGPSNDLTLL